MSKKNKGLNAFALFMNDWKIEQERRGKKFPNGLKDVQRDPKLSEDWANISHERKAYYQSKAKDSKIQAQGSISKKTTLGENIEEVIRAVKKEQQFQQNMLEYIDYVISVANQRGNLDEIKFILIHINWFYRQETGINKYDYGPAEFAVGEFSLGNGAENIYHEILNTKIPLGWKGDALRISNETHKISLEHPDGQSDYVYMYDNFIKLLKSNMNGKNYPPLFTIKDIAPAVTSLLKRMCDATKQNPDDFLIYSLEALFGGLRNAAVQKVQDTSIPLVVAEHEFNKELFSSVTGIECEFHKNTDASMYCSMSRIKQWTFTLCDYCCTYLGIPMIGGIQRPMSLPSLEIASYALDISMDKLKISEEKKSASTSKLNLNKEDKYVSMSGVTEGHRQKVSERTPEDEQRRRNESKTLEIIDHSKHNATGNVGIPGRPLRRPNTTSRAISEVKEDEDFLNISDFPPIAGRGIATNKKVTMNKSFPPLGRGSGSGKST